PGPGPGDSQSAVLQCACRDRRSPGVSLEWTAIHPFPRTAGQYGLVDRASHGPALADRVDDRHGAFIGCRDGPGRGPDFGFLERCSSRIGVLFPGCDDLFIPSSHLAPRREAPILGWSAFDAVAV